jgi:hypothetical protein
MRGSVAHGRTRTNKNVESSRKKPPLRVVVFRMSAAGEGGSTFPNLLAAVGGVRDRCHLALWRGRRRAPRPVPDEEYSPPLANADGVTRA